MGQWGAAFGVPFAVEGLFFFLEAIFIAIYIFGWKRLSPWAHFWTGVPIVIAGIGGTLSVVAANAWMNEPAGLHVEQRRARSSTSTRSKVIFNDAWPYEASHMLVAAYLVGGFMVASVYAVGMLKGRRDRYHRIGFLIPFTVAAIATPIQMAVGDTLARWVYNNEPVKFAAIELVPETESDVPETLLGRINSDGKVTGGIPIPGLASMLSDPSDGTSTVIQGLDSFPADERPTTRQVNTVHLAWDVMVGLGTLLFLLSAWYWLTWIFRRDMPKSKLFLRIASVRRRRRGARDGSGLGRHRGRPAAVDRLRPHEGRGRGDRQRGRVDHVPRRGRALPRARGDRRVGAAHDEPAVPRTGRARRPRRPVRPASCPEADRDRSRSVTSQAQAEARSSRRTVIEGRRLKPHE